MLIGLKHIQWRQNTFHTERVHDRGCSYSLDWSSNTFRTNYTTKLHFVRKDIREKVLV